MPIALNTAYTADRAAALAGVPTSTLHYWARKEILTPSVSSERVKLWSLPDLMALRTIAWLRRTKEKPDGYEIPATSMRAVRKALGHLAKLDLSLWAEDGRPSILVDRQGHIAVHEGEGKIVRPEDRQLLEPKLLDLTAPFSEQGRLGPDLRRPRPLLRIVPGKLAGATHIADTRLETEAIFALARRGFSPDAIARLYPFATIAAIAEAIDLEQDLSGKAA